MTDNTARRQRPIKALFFDIDGTLVSFKTHVIPASTVEALTQARARGVEIYISTGRPLPFIVNLGQIEHLISGYITTNGAHCFVGSHTVARHAIRPDHVEAILQKCEECHKAAVVVGEQGIAVVDSSGSVAETFGRQLGLGDFPFVPLEQAMSGAVLQVSPFLTPAEEAELMPRIPHCTSGRWTDVFTDITAVEADKGQGLEAMARHLGLDISQTMAFGDGGNDIAILRTAGVGVAMGNASDDVKRHADYVTTSVDDDGVRNALVEYGVIISPQGGA